MPAHWNPATQPCYEALPFSRALMRPGEVHELRVIAPDHTVVSGWFDVPEVLCAYANRYDGRGDVYVTVNPVKRRPTNRMTLGRATSDGMISRIRWLPVDFDNRGDGPPDDLVRFLRFRGFAEPLAFSSGHGCWLLYQIDSPNDAEHTSQRKRFLHTLKSRFPAVDTSVYNASRVMRLPGTLNLKAEPVRAALLGVTP